MKQWYTKLVSFLKRIFLYFRLHIHVEAGIKKTDNQDKNTSSLEDD